MYFRERRGIFFIKVGIRLILSITIVGGSDDTAEAKKQIMRENGIHVVDSPAEIGKKVKEVLG